MLYRKPFLSNFYYFLKSIGKLWIVPLIVINIIVPAVDFMLYKFLGKDAEPDIVNILYILLPVFTVWTSVFVTELFFSEKTKEVFFFYKRSKRFFTSSLYFILLMIDTVAVTLLQFYCIEDFAGMAVKILCITLFYYGIAMIVIAVSKSSTMAILALLLYNLLNDFVYSDFFLFYKSEGILTFSIFLFRYLPLALLGIASAIIVFAKSK